MATLTAEQHTAEGRDIRTKLLDLAGHEPGVLTHLVDVTLPAIERATVAPVF